MKEYSAVIKSKINPDLFSPPHVLNLLLELLGGEGQLDSAQQEQLSAHLAVCHYCRTAIVFLLEVAREYDRRNNNAEEPTRKLLEHFTYINREIEAKEQREAEAIELMGAYAEAVVAEGQERAAQLFPDVAAHLRTCHDCRSILEETLASLSELDENA